MPAGAPTAFTVTFIAELVPVHDDVVTLATGVGFVVLGEEHDRAIRTA